MLTAVRLRDVAAPDIPVFFEHQQDPAANHLAAFTSANPTDRAAFEARWGRILADQAIVKRTVLVDGQVAGHVVCFEQFGEMSVSYWIGREFWNRGVATKALAALLGEVAIRPLHARAASDNVGSIRVLQKCGFAIVGADKGFSNARGVEVEEVVLRL